MHKELIKQAIFGVLFQGGPGIIPSKVAEGVSNCAYRGEGGKCCSIGWLVSDEEYNEDMESKLFVSTYNLIGKELPDVVTVDILGNIQSIHDITDNLDLASDEWRSAFIHGIESDMIGKPHRWNQETVDMLKEILHEWETEGKILLAYHEAILKVWKQGKKSADFSGGCRYRLDDEDNVCCLVGHLISDENYERRFEGYGAGESRILDAVYKSIGVELDDELRNKYSSVIYDLQEAHDYTEDPDNTFRDSFKGNVQTLVEDGNIPIYFKYTLAQLK